MKRDESIIPLSWNHHDGLVFAKRLRESLDNGSQTPKFLADAIQQAWRDDLSAHFAAEEDILAPAIRETGDAGCAEALDRMFDEHTTIRELVQSIDGTANVALMREFSQRLTDHIRFEERDLFEMAQSALSKAALEALSEPIHEAAPPSRACPIPPAD